MQWRRLKPTETGYLSVMSLASCEKVDGWPAAAEKHINVTNNDGNLVCDWVKQPPPQVGDLAYNPRLSNRKPDHNCR